TLIKRDVFAGSAQQPRPLTIFKNLIYLEASEASIRALEVLTTPCYTYISKSDEISVFAEHLFQESKVVKWDYKLYPDSQIFIIRADGKGVIATFYPEQQVNAFTRFDTDGLFKDIVAVQEGTETAMYPTVLRDNGPWIERFASRYYSDH